jgi:flagellar biosynthesis/type III secretory pathway M-ring protein FliF/YscJ
MTDQVEGKWVVPNPQVPRTFGILNIIFGIMLLLVGLYSIVMLAIGPKLQSTIINQMKEQDAVKKADKDAKLAALKKKEETAKTKEEKEAIDDEREAVEKSSEPMVSAIMSEAMSVSTDPRIVAYTAVEATAGMILNVALVISGIGLLRMSEWGRRLALGVAWLKILRWVAIVLFTLVVIVPITTEMTQKVMNEVEKQAKAKSGGGGMPFPIASMGQFAAIAAAVTSVMSALFASIYPALSLWFLTRPSARAALMARVKPAGSSPEFDVGVPS